MSLLDVSGLMAAGNGKMIKEDVCPGAVSTNREVWKSVAGEPDPFEIIWPVGFR